jgi:hypothetical protein
MTFKPVTLLLLALTFGSGYFAASLTIIKPESSFQIEQEELSMSEAFIQSVYQVPDEELLSVIDFFVNSGGDVNYSTPYNETALRVSFLRGKMKSFAKLMQLEADPMPLGWPDGFMDIAINDLDAVKKVFPDTAGASVLSKSGMSPYLLAVEVGDIDKAAYLRPLTPEIGLRGGENRLPAMYFAAQNGRSEMVD